MSGGSISRELFRVAEPSSWKPWVIASIVAIVILGVALGLMGALGFFDIPKDDPGTKTLAAALGLVGSVLAAVVTLVGTVVKYSIDDRNARLAAIEASRNYALALEAEKRNRIEAAIRAVDLLSENNKDSTPNQIGGSILALVSLGEFDLAVALLSQLWPTGLAQPFVAGYVLTGALESDSIVTQRSAATVLNQNAAQIQQGESHIWPIRPLGWRTDLDGNCRLGLVCAAAQWMKSAISTNRQRFPDAAAVLYFALEDPKPVVSDVAAAGLRPIVQVFNESTYLDSGDTKVSIADIKNRLANFSTVPTTSYGFQIESELRKLLQPTQVGKPTSSDSNE